MHKTEPTNHPAMLRLRNYARESDDKYQEFYRYKSRIICAIHCMVLRRDVKDVDDLRGVEEFPESEFMSTWSAPIKLFEADVKTISDWADSAPPELVGCKICLLADATR